MSQVYTPFDGTLSNISTTLCKYERDARRQHRRKVFLDKSGTTTGITKNSYLG